MSFFVDAQEQREKARRAEQRLLEHSAVRTPRRSRIPDDEDEDGPPPVFLRDGTYQQTRATSIEKRGVRFRDGVPPPPPEVAPQHIQRVLPPPPVPLVDQLQFDQHRGALPETRSADELSQSQKKRLRRKRNREERRTQPPLAASTPTPASTNGVASDLPPPSPTHPGARESCDASCVVLLPDGSEQTIVCRLAPFPHPNQPHLVQMRDANGRPNHAAEIFVGFWLPGE